MIVGMSPQSPSSLINPHVVLRPRQCSSVPNHIWSTLHYKTLQDPRSPFPQCSLNCFESSCHMIGLSVTLPLPALSPPCVSVSCFHPLANLRLSPSHFSCTFVEFFSTGSWCINVDEECQYILYYSAPPMFQRVTSPPSATLIWARLPLLSTITHFS